MEKQYPIYYGGEKVGEARLEQKGMFWHVKCRCMLETADTVRIIAKSKQHKLDLGLYPRDTRGSQVERWLSAKTLSSAEVVFYLERQKQEYFVPVTETAPFPALEKLSKARFASDADEPGLWIGD